MAEIAEELRLSPATIRSWISKGTLRAMRAGHRKWLVRRSELDRMLRGEDFEDAPSPPPDRSATGRRRRQRRFPDTITPPIARLGPPEEDVDPEEWLGIVQWEWLSALRQSEMAPPDAWFPGRLQLIAEAAARKAAALALFPEDEQMRWESEPEGLGLTLSYELRPGGNRPGPPELWAEFDSAVGRLGIAMQAGEAGLIRGSLEELSVTLHDIADSLERYRGRYGNWTERPTKRPAKDADRGADGSAATE
ncbi:MAG: helix-turn-helix domain-containing protein [Solirubrobacteraceae bacterium]